jgi:hypothetical protein
LLFGLRAVDYTITTAVPATAGKWTTRRKELYMPLQNLLHVLTRSQASRRSWREERDFCWIFPFALVFEVRAYGDMAQGFEVILLGYTWDGVDWEF